MAGDAMSAESECGYVGQVSLGLRGAVWAVVDIDDLDDEQWCGRQLADDEPVAAEEFGTGAIAVTLRDPAHPRCGQVGRARVAASSGPLGGMVLVGTGRFGSPGSSTVGVRPE